MASASETPATPSEAGPLSFGLQSRDVVPLVAIAAGLASGLSGQQPTGNIAADFVLPFAFGAAIVWLSQFAKTQAVLISAVLALFFSGLQMPGVLLGVAAVAAVIFTTSWRPFDKESTTISLAVSAAFTSQTVLNLPSVRFVGSASLLAAIALVPLFVVGFRNLPKLQRKYAIRGGLALLTFAVVASILAVVTALGVRDDIETAIVQAEAGVDAVQAGNQPEALSLLQAAQDNFERAGARLGGPLTWPARFVPVTAQHSRALETAADQGTALVSTAARTVTQADVEKIRGQNGQLDLDLVLAVDAELSRANGTLRGAQQALLDVSTPWLLPQLSSRLATVRQELETTAAEIDLANHATSVLPRMFGANGQRRYLVLFVQPAESREFGGLVGAYGLLEVDQGNFNLAESGSIHVDFGLGDAEFANAGLYPESFVTAFPQVNPQNLTATADLATINEAIQELAPQWRNIPDFTIDGVITIDPYALAALLELTGPLPVGDRAEPIDASNVVDFLLRDQYLEFEQFERDVRQDALKDLAGQAFDRLFAIEIPGPERLGELFGPVARANRLSMITQDDQENAFLDRVFLSANLPQVGSAVDMLGIYTQTGTASKLDGYASRSINYEVVVDPATGSVTGDLAIVDQNDAPSEAGQYVLGNNEIDDPTGEPLARGSNFLAMGIYTRATVESLQSSTAFLIEDPLPALSYDRYPIKYTVPLGETAQVTATLRSQVEPGRYDIFIPAQASANVADFTLSVRATPGWRIIDGPNVAPDGSWLQEFKLDEARGFTVAFERIG